jgi:hypothetical protein
MNRAGIAFLVVVMPPRSSSTTTWPHWSHAMTPETLPVIRALPVEDDVAPLKR